MAEFFSLSYSGGSAYILIKKKMPDKNKRVSDASWGKYWSDTTRLFETEQVDGQDEYTMLFTGPIGKAAN